MHFSDNLIRGTVAPMVLAMLAERPMYGYEIIKLVNARTGGKLQWKEGTLYPALHRMQADGLLTAAWEEAPTDADAAGRKRKYYHITRKGRAHLARQAKQWKELAEAVDAVMLRWC
ncbi:MAG: PadR family transcriptional regulator [Planctomycetes bacterium]|nr:PadR family transcriptional regulator [Planctomycetota bacterium]